jgi:hypothetical protein
MVLLGSGRSLRHLAEAVATWNPDYTLHLERDS